MSKHPDLAAFPFDIKNTYDKPVDFMGVEIMPGGRAVSAGMGLRDYFAAKAMAGILANESIRPFSGHFSANEEEHYVARLAYKVADAMLEVRK